ncbi:MAG: FAD-dependent oxidoreductase, partial [Gammaproteobacteria bacterium]|nr:FAD-dependent oxidoreductase [Gammaproteobacteria bacterium]
MKYHPTIIAGGGWAGLAAAVELSQRNIPVTVFESAKQLGGRARSLPTENTLLDNGQHLMIGAYSQMQSLLNTIGVNTREAFLQIPQQLEMLDLNSREKVFELKLPRLPTPLHLLVGMLQCPSLSFKQKLQTLLRFNRLLNQELEQDMSVDDWLNSAGLPEAYTEYLLKPLCLAALTTHTHEASARAFQTVLQQTFNGPASNTDLLIPATDLGNIFPAAAKHYIESKGGQVLTEHRVSQLNLAQDKVESITVNDQRVEVEQLILATPPPVTQKLLTGIPACDDITQQLSRLDYEPVTTVYLQY